jgi:cyclopropane-fatty-acyl-phospholipid synthase
MKATIIPADNELTTTTSARLLDRMAKRAVFARLRQLRHGELIIAEQDGTYRFGETNAQFAVSVTVRVRDPRFYSDLAFGGSIGAGEAYMEGLWECDQLTDLVRLLLRNRQVLDGMDGSLSILSTPLHKVFHWLNRNTVSGSRRNIQAHYDIGNDLFSAFLDSTMMYSCGIFETTSATLEQASLAKLDRICRKLALKPGDHVLEIGTGWGGFAIHAAKYYGCRVTTTTISEQQYELARQRIAEAGLEDQISLLKQDYRQLNGKYDKLVSIEMIEAIGHQYFDTFFAKCSALLKPDGLMLLQSITIADQRYDAARRSVDFIQRYIFPGSCIPSISVLAGSAARSSDMCLYNLEDIGPHYALTLQRWRERFFENIQAIRKMGYSNRFARMWEFYLCYCEGGFMERAIGDVQMLFTKPLARRAAVVPALSRDAMVDAT